MQKKIQLEEEFKMPPYIKRNVRQTLDQYRLIGDVAGLYVDGLLQTLIDFTNFIDPDFAKNQLNSPNKINIEDTE